MPAALDIEPGSEVQIDPADAVDTTNALDALLKEAGGEGELGDKPAADAPPADKSAADAPPADKPAADASPADKPAADAPPADKPAADAPPADKPAADPLDAVELPPHVKPKTVEAWTKLKETARTKIAEISAEAEKTRTELATLRAENEALKKNPVSAEVQKELDELRDFRQKLEVEADPSFRKFEEQIADNVQAIYSRLTKAGFSKENIARIKELGGPDKVNWEPLREKLPADLQRYLDAKLVENEDLIEKKSVAVSKAKERAGEFLKNRQAELEHSTTGFKEQVKKEFEALGPKLPWLKTVDVPKDAKPEDRAKIEASNAAIKAVQQDIADAIEDNSPGMRAVLLAGYATMLRLQGEAKNRDATHKAEVTELKTKITGLEKTITEKDEFIKKVKGASTGRLFQSSAPDGSAKKTKGNAEPTNVDESGSAALDRIRKEVEASQDNE